MTKEKQAILKNNKEIGLLTAQINSLESDVELLKIERAKLLKNNVALRAYVLMRENK